ncbi:hypothetical protein C8Q77DRAFT_1076794 [Trametes polyzona]|nr:hypothetical protein C8Q77DRAFT_1076794 [Trametes polyzona]
MPAPTFVAQQPRWLILSAFLFLWSISSGFRRDGRGNALGLGVEARAHLPVADVVIDGQADVWKRQVVIPNCAVICASQAASQVGCGEGLNLGCACHSPSFLPDTVNCMDKNCTSIDEQEGQRALQNACLAAGTSTTSASSTTTFSVSSTSITSGPPPICTTVSPTSASGTTTVSVTATVTVTSAPGTSTTAPSDSGTSSPTSAASSDTSSDASSTSASIPVITTTTMVTSSSTVVLPTSGSATHPVTTVTSTSTLGGLPTDGTGTDGTGPNGTGTGGAVPTTERGAVGVALAVCVALGAALLW